MFKKLIIVVVVMSIFIIMFSDSTFIQSDNNSNLIEKDYIKSKLSDWFNTKFAQIYNIKQINFYFEREELENGKNVYFVLASMIHILKLQDVDEHPVIEAVSEFIKTNSDNLPNETKSLLENFVLTYKNNLEGYIKNWQELNVRFKIVASGEDCTIYIEDPHQNYKIVDEYYLILFPQKLKDLVLNSLNVELLNYEENYKELFGEGKPNLNYDDQKAVEYANKYTSNTSNINSQCGDNPIVYQDKSFYNPDYIAYDCTDCADYVSQAVHAGEIPYDFLWHPGVSIWACADGCSEDSSDDLFSYMLSHYCFLSRNGIYAIPGSIAMFDWNNNTSPDHATVVVYNGGYTLKFSAHTSDKKEYLLPINFDTRYLIFY